MRFRKLNIVLPGILSVFLLGTYAGKTSIPVPGLSPYYMSITQWEEGVFERAQQKHLDFAESYNNEMRENISRIISQYRTGLDKKYPRVANWIVIESRKYGYDPLFLTALIMAESSFNNRARSHRGAMGLMQIKPGTGRAIAGEAPVKWRGVPTLFDPDSNITLGTYYLNKLVMRFGDLSLALEAYNHGPSQLTRYLKKGYRPKRYSEKIFAIYKKLRAQLI